MGAKVALPFTSRLGVGELLAAAVPRSLSVWLDKV